jgi:uncharacterized protein (TIGR02996 family)
VSVYFVYRSHYDTPSLNHVRRFEDDTVLAWFQRHWQGIVDSGQANDHVRKLFGCHVYGLSSLFEHIAEHSLPPPASSAALKQALEEHLYAEGEVLYRPHSIQVLTDDDELEMAYYFFDDHFLAGHADRAAFILREGWRLPVASGAGAFRPGVPVRKLEPAGRGDGVTYLAFLAWYDSANLDDLEGAWSIRGVRLPDLARHLATTIPGPGYSHEGGWPFELKLLRSQVLDGPAKAPGEEKALLRAIREQPGDVSRWQVHADWLEEHGQGRNAVLERALRASGRYPVGYICNSLSTGGFGGKDLDEAREQLAELMERFGDRRSHDPRKSLVQADDQVAQLCLHTGRRSWSETDLYHRWVLFDDRWGSAQPALANAILRYAKRWDVLT